MTEPKWLRRDAMLAVHEMLLAEFGGLHGIRDEGLFESALARPQQVVAYGSPTLFELASAYVAGLIRNHPFVDGNKRIGFMAAITFLETNGLTFHATEADAVVRTLALAARQLTEEDYAAWLKKHSKKK